jgi:hypothetical protein
MKCLTVTAILLLLVQQAGALAGGAKTVFLKAEIEVSGPALALADFLPEDAPASLRDRLSSIRMGRAPLPNSRRLLMREEIQRHLQQVPDLSEEIRIPAQITVSRSSRIVAASEIHEAIVAALQAQGVNSSKWPSVQEVRVSAPLLATTDKSGLIVESIEPDGARRLTRFRMLLSNEELTVPFYATVHRLVNAENQPLEKNLRAQTAGAASRKNAGSARKTPILVRPGSSATLLVEAGPLRITTTVVPLQSGSQGQQILVRNPETRGTLRATVIAPNLLKQSLLNEVSE